ncbi:MAG: hypothetical protein KF729_08630 [Sandaracinaceae bacterium]|nr:hypothetical protein [Sandaracinaceae bacterium]
MRKSLALALFFSLGACDGATSPDAGAPDTSTAEDAGREACDFDPGPAEEIPEPAPRTARWAFEPWISKDISDRADSFVFVDGFIERDIPVGVLVIDSPWDAQYTTFVPNPSRYPDFGSMVREMNERGVRVVMWVTQMVNRTSYDLEEGGDTYRGAAPNYAQGCRCGYFVEDCKLYSWWKGSGSAVDFFHPDARAWWHRQQDSLLAMGIDGWKLDFGDSYLEADDPIRTHAGLVAHQDYSERYYQDFLAYGRHVRGRDFVTMVRPYDVSYDRRGRFHARPEHAPVGWVGDNHRDWTGIVDALDHVMRSAAAGYVVLGSDIGGYLDRREPSLVEVIPFDVEVFQRWVAWSGMMPFFQLHSRGNYAPWTVPERVEETVALYRYWATLHHEMVGFWYSLAEEAYASGDTILHPLGAEADWPGDYRYLVGDAFLVAPIVAPGDARDVALPAGARWYDFWDPAGAPIEGGTTLTDYAVVERERIPIFVREGAIVPVDVESAVTGLGDAASAGHLTVLAWPGATDSRFVLHETDEATTAIRTSRDAGGTVRVVLSRALRPTIVRLRADAAPSAVGAGGAALDERADAAAFGAARSGWRYDGASRWLWVKVEARDAEVSIEVTP